MGKDCRRMTAVVFNRKRIDALLINDAALRFRCAANEVCDVALCMIKLPDCAACPCLDRRHCAGTHIFVILIITLVASFIEPFRTILEIKIRRTAIVNKTMQIGLVRHKGNIEPACGQRK